MQTPGQRNSLLRMSAAVRLINGSENKSTLINCRETDRNLMRLWVFILPNGLDLHPLLRLTLPKQLNSNSVKHSLHMKNKCALMV